MMALFVGLKLQIESRDEAEQRQVTEVMADSHELTRWALADSNWRMQEEKLYLKGCFECPSISGAIRSLWRSKGRMDFSVKAQPKWPS